MLGSRSLALMKTNLVKHINHVRLTRFTPRARWGDQYPPSFHAFLFDKFDSDTKMPFHRGSYRGSHKGRSSWRGGAWALPTSSSRRAEPLPNLKPLGPTIDSINIKILLTEEDTPTITGVNYVASYNWLNGKSPVILVPGEFQSHSAPNITSLLVQT
jgi:hypothetical protein